MVPLPLERQFSEAAIRLAEEAERVCPGVPWRDIRGMGNQLRHAYERVDLNTIWNTVVDDLPVLKAAVGDALSDCVRFRKV